MFRVAMVGAGGMAGVHAGCYSRLPNTTVVGVMDVRKEAADALASSHGAPGFTDFAEMMETVKPDIVDVCVPTPWHVDYVVQAAAYPLRGVSVEKPMGRTVADCRRMTEACEAAKVPLFVAHVLRFFPEFVAAKAQVDAGAVGNVAAVRTRRGGPFPRAWENWYGKLDWSGGLTLDLAIHDFDWLRWTFGEVDRVFAKGLMGGQPAGAEVGIDYTLATLRFVSGVVAHVEATWADPGGFKVGIEIAGDEGLLEYNFNQPSGSPFVASVAQTATGGGVAVPESPVAVSPYQLELAHFVDSLERGAPASVSPRDGLEAVRISLAVIESMRTGKPIHVPGYGE
jgi:predicted dehydrogenase